MSVKRSNFKIGDRVRIAKKRTTFAKGYTPNWTEEVFEVVEIQNTNPVDTISKWNGVTIEGSFYEPELQKTSQYVFRIENVIQKTVEECWYILERVLF